MSAVTTVSATFTCTCVARLSVLAVKLRVCKPSGSCWLLTVPCNSSGVMLPDADAVSSRACESTVSLSRVTPSAIDTAVDTTARAVTSGAATLPAGALALMLTCNPSAVGSSCPVSTASANDARRWPRWVSGVKEADSSRASPCTCPVPTRVMVSATFTSASNANTSPEASTSNCPVAASGP